MKLIFKNIEICRFRKKRLVSMFLCLFVMAVQRVTSLEQMEKIFRQSIKKEKDTFQFQSPDSYTAVQIQDELTDAAKSQGRLLAGNIRITRGNCSYIFQRISEENAERTYME